MGKDSKQNLKDKTKSRLDDLQRKLADLQNARKEGRSDDAVAIEEQVNKEVCDWKDELDRPTPASSLHQDGSLGSFSDFSGFLQKLCEEEDDAISNLHAPMFGPEVMEANDNAAYLENLYAPEWSQQEQRVHFDDRCKGSTLGVHDDLGITEIGAAAQLDHQSFDLHLDFDQDDFFDGLDGNGIGTYQEEALPASAFLGPKCALWDCPRPAQGWFPDNGQAQEWCCIGYCSTMHAKIAQNEGRPGTLPVVRPKGIALKDDLLIAALNAKTQGKDVGIPECTGAATAKSPWNAPDLFDINVFPGETIREWLFFDAPRRAFESGNRKQRSLPDYDGRGWHESRKVVDETWRKKSYYMDPQPMKSFEWHLYEYEIINYDACALYRLELKLADKKKTPKGKAGNVSVVDLQKQMGKLTAGFPLENNDKSVKGRGKATMKDKRGANVFSVANQTPGLKDGFDVNRVEALENRTDNAPLREKYIEKDNTADDDGSASNDTGPMGGSMKYGLIESYIPPAGLGRQQSVVNTFGEDQ